MFKFKTLPSSIWAIDGEWIPDASLGKRLYDLPQETSEEEVFQEMWNAAGADEIEKVKNQKSKVKSKFSRLGFRLQSENISRS